MKRRTILSTDFIEAGEQLQTELSMGTAAYPKGEGGGGGGGPYPRTMGPAGRA